MALMNFLNPKKQLEEGDRTSAPMQRDAGEPEKNCPNCHKDIPLSRLWANDLVCPCGYHFRMKARQRIQMIADKGSFHEMYAGMKSDNPLNFPGYKDKVETVRVASGEEEAVVCGTAMIGKQKCCLFVMESYFMMGSMGSAVGEKITSLFEYPTTFSDEIEIEVSLAQYTGVKLSLSYVMKDINTGIVVAIASSSHCFIDDKGRPIVVRKHFPDFDSALREVEKSYS